MQLGMETWTMTVIDVEIRNRIEAEELQGIVYP
jgi:hypothetical protein